MKEIKEGFLWTIGAMSAVIVIIIGVKIMLWIASLYGIS